MDNQDFEAYAKHKPFNNRISIEWRVTGEEALSCLARSRSSVRVLDYGCGDGKYFSFFSSSGINPENIIGLDVSSTRIQRCKSIGFFGAQLLEPNLPIPFEDSSFDLVNCMEVIEHIPSGEGEKVLSELRRVLRPGGILLISTPNYPIKRFYDISDAVFHGLWNRLSDDPTHVTFYNEPKLRFLLKKLFANVESRTFKNGYLYKRIKISALKHKLFFICTA